MTLAGFDFQSTALIGGIFAAGFVLVWIFLTLRQDETRDRGKD